MAIPEIHLKSGFGKIPVLGFGTAADPPADFETTKTAVLEGINVGYRHFDTASLYNSEQPIGEAVAEAISRGLLKSRDQLFITSKLWCSDAHPQHVVPALKKTLRNLGMDYVDLYLIHWPVSATPGKWEYPIKAGDFLEMEFGAVWAAMEECQKMGLAKAIGVSNFTCEKLQQILSTAKIKPAVNQVCLAKCQCPLLIVEVNPCWQQKKLIKFCEENGILVVGYAPLGAVGTFYGTGRVVESQVLKEIASANGKTVPQVCLRWGYEQGIGVVVKSFNKERMQENLKIFDWSLSSQDMQKISEIPQSRSCLGKDYTSVYGPYNTIQQLWDGQV